MCACTSSMHRVLSWWKRCRNGPTRWYTYSNWNSVWTMGFSVSDMNLQSHKYMTTWQVGRTSTKMDMKSERGDNKPAENFLTWVSETAVRWMSDARQRALTLARSCSSSHCSSGGRLWSQARRRGNLPAPSPTSAPGSQSQTQCGHGGRSNRAPEREEMEGVVNKLRVISSKERNDFLLLFIFLTGSAVITSPIAFIQVVIFSRGTRGWLKSERRVVWLISNESFYTTTSKSITQKKRQKMICTIAHFPHRSY